MNDDLKDAVWFAQSLPIASSTVTYDINELEKTNPDTRKHVDCLVKYNLATRTQDIFMIKRGTINQPASILEKMIPSLLALDSARRFGKESDVSFMKNNMPENSIITLDYKAWELVKYQTPEDLYIYVDNMNETAEFLKSCGFDEGKGHIILLPKIGSFDNPTERLVLDCIASGGRDILDAIAIILSFNVKTNATFATDMIVPVTNNLQSFKVENLV